MILKGNQRAGASDLATHLMNAAENELIDIAEIRGAIAGDLHGAFAEYAGLAAGTKCTEPLYSLSINPSAPITRAQYMQAIERIERRLGLTGQPRAVIFHVKAGTRREHCHVVWSRIDVSRMRAVQLSHDHLKLRTLARELALEFGLDLPPGLAEEREYDRFEGDEMSMAEKAQVEASGITPEERRADITAAYCGADSAASFMQALEEMGYFVAIGDRRAYVVVDRFGHVHSLARQIKGVRAKDLKRFFADVEVRTLDEAKTLADSFELAAKDRRRELLQQKISDLAAKLRRKQASRRLEFLRGNRALRAQQAREQSALYAAQERETARPFAHMVSAVLGLFTRLPVLRSVLAHLHCAPFVALAERHELEREALARRHERERADQARIFACLRKVERRERASLLRAALRALRARDHKAQIFVRNGADITRRSRAVRVAEDAPMAALDEERFLNFLAILEEGLAPVFNAHAAPMARSVGEGEDHWSEDYERYLDELFDYGLSPFFNHAAGADPRRSDASEGYAPRRYGLDFGPE